MTQKLFKNACITTPIDPGHPLSGDLQGKTITYKRGALLCVNGMVEAIGEEKDVFKTLSARDVDMEVDCEGLCLIPGFVDPHTHMCFSETREQEFTLRMSGTPYLEILRRGGGILSSVRSVREASEETLFQRTLEHAHSALSFGTTTVEIKSGYGLDTDTELKMLRVIDRVERETPMDVIPTFLGAHAVPEEFKGNPDGYVTRVIEEMIPKVSRQGIARFCDIFCEEGVFSVDQSRHILGAAREAGLVDVTSCRLPAAWATWTCLGPSSTALCVTACG